MSDEANEGQSQIAALSNRKTWLDGLDKFLSTTPHQPPEYARLNDVIKQDQEATQSELLAEVERYYRAQLTGAISDEE